MTTKQIKNGLVTGAAAALVAALAVAGWALLVPVSVSVSGNNGDGAVVARANAPGGRLQLPTPQQLAQLATLDLRRPLKDKPVMIKAPPPLAAKLVGTIYEPANPGQSAAIFMLNGGAQGMFKAGDAFNDPTGEVKVLEIGDKRVTIHYRGQQRELTHP